MDRYFSKIKAGPIEMNCICDDDMPDDEIHFCQGGRCVGKMVNVGFAKEDSNKEKNELDSQDLIVLPRIKEFDDCDECNPNIAFCTCLFLNSGVGLTDACLKEGVHLNGIFYKLLGYVVEGKKSLSDHPVYTNKSGVNYVADYALLKKEE